MNQWTESLWGDEAFSAVAVMKNFWGTMGVVMRDTSPPGFYILGWIWVRIFGSSEIALRSLTLLLVLGAAVFAGMIVYKINESKLSWFLTFLLAFGAPFMVPFAFEWRMYALLCFATLGSVYFYIVKKWWWWIGFSLLAVYTHHFGLFTVMGEGLAFLLFEFRFKNWKKLWPFVVLGVLYLPGAYLTYMQTIRVKGSGFWLSVPQVKDLMELLYRFFTGGIKQEWRIPVALVGMVFLAVKDWRAVWKKWLSLLVIFLAPVFLSYLVSQVVTPIFYDRYLLSVAMGMVVLLMTGVENDFWPFVIVLIGAFWWQSYVQFAHPQKKNFRELAAYVKTVEKPGDRLITIQRAEHHLWESKYYGIPTQIYAPKPLPLYVGTAQMTEEDILISLPKVKRLGLITSEPIEKVDLPGYKLTEVKEFDKGLSFSWWVPR